jgi:hypothetical protein
MPLRSSCKYLGVWIDADRSDRTLRNALLEKFRAAVPVFFALCRRMRISSVTRVFHLAQALLFSLLYGAEFLGRMDVVSRCELAWWSGVRAFYGLPNGVSNVSLSLLFPDFSLVHRVLLSKMALVLRGLRRLTTLLPEALIFDRGYLFERHRVGFNQVIKDWGLQLGIPEFFLCTDRIEAGSQLCQVRTRSLDSAWETFSRMPSTNAVASILRSRQGFFEAAREASKFSRLGLRVFMLAITGSFAQSYLKSRGCHSCGTSFSFEHFISCPSLGDDLRLALETCADNEDWRGFVLIILTRFQVFLHLHRNGVLDQDEVDLFSAVNEVGTDE